MSSMEKKYNSTKNKMRLCDSMRYFIFHDSALNLSGGHQQLIFNKFISEPKLGHDKNKNFKEIQQINISLKPEQCCNIDYTLLRNLPKTVLYTENLMKSELKVKEFTD